MVERLQSLLKGDEATEISTREIMEYFFNRLQSHDMKERDHAVKVITLQAATNTVYGCIFSMQAEFMKIGKIKILPDRLKLISRKL